jgi:predicted 3-demethylubiquinone-9 3-methyltransferase (glyoxalase superfamily)
MMTDPDRDKARRVTEAMLKMVKLDIAGLRSAYEA